MPSLDFTIKSDVSIESTVCLMFGENPNDTKAEIIESKAKGEIVRSINIKSSLDNSFLLIEFL